MHEGCSLLKGVLGRCLFPQFVVERWYGQELAAFLSGMSEKQVG